MAQQANVPFFRPWTLQTADMAYQLIQRAGSGDKTAKNNLEYLKKQAQKNNPQAVQAKVMLDVVAKYITNGLPKPSEVAKQLGRKRAGQPSRQAQAQMALKQAQQAKMLAQRQAQGERTRQQMERMKQAEGQRLEQQAALRRQAAARIAVRRAEQDEAQDEIDALEDKLAQIEQQQTIDAEVKRRLAAQEMPAEPELVAPISKVEDFAEAQPSEAAPGDVEFNG